MPTKPPPDFESWEQCRDYYALEAIFLGQRLDRYPGPRNEKAYWHAAELAIEASKHCEEEAPNAD